MFPCLGMTSSGQMPLGIYKVWGQEITITILKNISTENLFIDHGINCKDTATHTLHNTEIFINQILCKMENHYSLIANPNILTLILPVGNQILYPTWDMKLLQ